MNILSSYDLIIGASIIVILSFFYNAISQKTNVPSVLMLIFTGLAIKIGMQYMNIPSIDFFPILEMLGIVGLIMIVLEAALELELEKEKLVPILKAFSIALIGLLVSIYAASEILLYFIKDMTRLSAWIYATPISILSSAIIIPSVAGFSGKKKEFHIYESTFSDILGILIFYFLTAQITSEDGESGSTMMFFANFGITIIISLVSGYILILVFQNIKSQIKLFLLISSLLLLYAIGKKMHFSSLIIILIFGLIIANMKLFFQGRIGKYLNPEKAKLIYDGLHVITGETSFVVRTFFFVVFGITISISSIKSIEVVTISGLILLSIYLIRFLILKIFIRKDIFPQLFIAPRGLITILLFYAIPHQTENKNFDSGILLFIIISSSVIMTVAMVYDKHKARSAVRKAESRKIGYEKWKLPKITNIKNDTEK